MSVLMPSARSGPLCFARSVGLLCSSVGAPSACRLYDESSDGGFGVHSVHVAFG